MIDRDELNRLADMAMIKLDDSQLEICQKRLEDAIGLSENILKVNTKGVEPTITVAEVSEIGDHEQSQTLSREEVLKNTVEEQFGYFKILKVLE